MKVLVYGGSSSGKSEFAENLCTGEKKIYFATMPNIQSSSDRIQKHLNNRKNKSFITIEQEKNIVLPDDFDSLLFEDVSNLICNELYYFDGVWKENDSNSVINKLKFSLEPFLECESDVIFVGNDILDDSDFSKVLGEIQIFLASKVDTIYEIIAGIPVKLKGID